MIEKETKKIKVQKILLTGALNLCACPYAQNPNAPKSLCNYCYKNFQESMFEMLLDRPVTVQIDEGFLLDDKRYSTTMFFERKLEGLS